MPSIDAYRRVQQDGPKQRVIDHIELVRRVAIHLKARLPNQFELDDLIQAGTLGLIEAAQSFDASKGVAFEAFARQRIRGSILDEVRRTSVLPRSAVANLRSHKQAWRELAQNLGREPTHSELAANLGLSNAEFERERTHAHQFQTLALDDLPEEFTEAADSAADIASEIEAEQQSTQLAAAIAQLPERDQLILSLYYVEELNLKEVGNIIGVSESRISQILTANAAQLRRTLTT